MAMIRLRRNSAKADSVSGKVVVCYLEVVLLGSGYSLYYTHYVAFILKSSYNLRWDIFLGTKTTMTVDKQSRVALSGLIRIIDCSANKLRADELRAESAPYFEVVPTALIIP